MACKTGKCGKKSRENQVQRATSQIAAVDFTALTATQSVVRVGNKNVSIQKPLVKIKPPMGYDINIIVNGHKHLVQGTSPTLIIKAIIDVYALNNIEVAENTAWLNANIYWLSQLSIKHGYTTVEELRAIASVGKATPVILDDPTPADWGASAWKFVGAFISQGDVTTEQFLDILEILEDMLNDKFIGCEECAEHFTESLMLLRDREIKAVDMASWMFNTMNEIRMSLNKPLLTWEQAVRIHRWENL